MALALSLGMQLDRSDEGAGVVWSAVEASVCLV